MKAIEVISHTDGKGMLKLDYLLDKPDADVRILISLDEDKENPSWAKVIASNPAFVFLKDSEEDIYPEDYGVEIE